MINYTPANQLKFEDFSTPFDRGLNKENRWVKLAEVTPWDELAQIYASKLNSNKGKKSIDIRTILGALILKHKTRTSDREVLEMIVESPYLQFFCGYRSFSHRKPFDASLFVAIRERMGVEEFKGFNRILIAKAQEFKGSTTRKRSKQKKSDKDDTGDGGEVTHKGTLKLDATVCDQQIKHPTDLGLLNEARKKTEDFIDILYGPSALEQKPRTYRREAAEAYMAIAKMKQKSRKVIRKGIKQQLQYLRRNLGYLDHLPLHRQRKRFARQGINISKSTINGWVRECGNLLTGLYTELRKQVLDIDYLQVDETPIAVLESEKKGSTHRGYYWVYHNPLNKMVLFDYRSGRGRAGPNEILKDFNGHIQTDGYAVYKKLNNSNIKRIGCMAHARRYFIQAQDNDAQRAVHAVTRIAALYAIEKKAREDELTFDQRYALRQERALPILAELKEWFTDNIGGTLPKTPIRKAIAYSLDNWEAISLYTEDGRFEIDNNPIENQIRPIALGRKNYLFAGSHEAAQRAAMIYSLLLTCVLNEVEPQSWLTDTLSKIGSHPINRVSELLPINREAQ